MYIHLNGERLTHQHKVVGNRGPKSFVAVADSGSDETLFRYRYSDFMKLSAQTIATLWNFSAMDLHRIVFSAIKFHKDFVLLMSGIQF